MAPSLLPAAEFAQTGAAQPLWQDWKPAAHGAFLVAVRTPPSCSGLKLPSKGLGVRPVHVEGAGFTHEGRTPPGLQALRSKANPTPSRAGAEAWGVGLQGVGRQKGSNAQGLLDAFLPRPCPPFILVTTIEVAPVSF